MSHTSNAQPPAVVHVTSIRFAGTLYARIKEAAQADQRSVASWIRIACERELRLNNQGRA